MMVASCCSFETKASVKGAPSVPDELCEGFSDWLFDGTSALSRTDDCTGEQCTCTLVPLSKCRPCCLARILLVLRGTIGFSSFPLSELFIVLFKLDRMIRIKCRIGYVCLSCSENELPAWLSVMNCGAIDGVKLHCRGEKMLHAELNFDEGGGRGWRNV